MLRRTLLLALVVLPAVAFAIPITAPRDDADGLFFGVESADGPVLAERLPFRDPHVFSRDNTNRTFTAWFATDRFADDRSVFLRHGARIRRVTSRGGDDTHWSVSLEVDRDTAEVLAAWLGVPLQERTPLGEGLRGEFSLVSGTEIRVRIRNTADRAVGVVVGGRNRGPRNNQFSFEVRRDGQVVPPIEGWDLGGLSTVRVLAAGESFEVSEDAAKWASFAEPGRYDVRCRYEAELLKGNGYPTWPEQAHESWDLAVEGTVGWVGR